MAELTNLESKLGEVLGLAMAAQGATEKVKKLDDLDDDLAKALDRMNDEAKEAEERATEVAESFEFLTMAEAGEVGHWEVLRTLNERARNAGVRELVDWGIPIQQRHFEQVRQGSLKLAAEEDPNETA